MTELNNKKHEQGKTCEKCSNIFIPSVQNEKYCRECRTFICQNCGKEFIVKNKQRADENPKFCSKKCFYKRREYKKICHNCGSEFYSKSNNILFCKNCRTFTCFTCGEIFTVNRTQHTSHAKYCSKECMLKDPYHLVHNRICERCNEPFKSLGASKLCVQCRTLKCEYCDNSYTVKSYSVSKSKFCSQSCHDKNRMIHVWTDEDITFIKRHYLKDMTLNEIAVHFNVSFKSLYNVIEKNNIQKRVSLTKHDIINQIKNLHEAKIELNYTNMRKHKKGDLLSSAFHLFGSWKNAIVSSGIKYESVNLYSSRKKWNKKTILNTIYELYAQGESLKFTDIKQNHYSLYMAATQNKNIGSWANALEQLGIDYDEIKGTPWGSKYYGLDGHIYFSILEGRVGDTLYEFKKLKKIKLYKTQVKVTSNRNWSCDFLIFLNGGQQLWLEVDGLKDKRDNPYILQTSSNTKKNIKIYSEKIKFYIDNGYNFEIIYDNTEVENVLLNHIESYYTNET